MSIKSIVNNFKKNIIYHLLSPLVCLFFTECQLGDTKLTATKKEADTVVIHFYNVSVSPDFQFYNIIQIVKDTYHITSQKGNGENVVETVNVNSPQGAWVHSRNRVHLFFENVS